MNPPDLVNLKATEDLRALLQSMGEEPYRGDQLSVWIYQRGATQFDVMTDLSLELRQKLRERSIIPNLSLLGRTRAEDETEKYLFGLDDGLKIETIAIPEEDHTTLCISTQVGCPLACGFCATGRGGFQRDLEAWEMVDQVLQVRSIYEGRIRNVVLMGMGEPLLNYPAVLTACRVLNRHLRIGSRRITISTAGIVPGILRLATEPEQFRLAVSLNASNDWLRQTLMPIARRYSLSELMEAISRFLETKGKRVTLEYVLLGGVNDTAQHAYQLVQLAAGMLVKVNLIPYNPVPDLSYQASTKAATYSFQRILQNASIETIIRKSKGSEIQAACGQLVVPHPSHPN